MALSNADKKHVEVIMSNINVLGMVVKIPAGVTGVLKEDMFAVPNKKGFFELVYFFLNTADPVKCKEYIIWPCLNKSDEIKFRLGVNKLIPVISERSEGMVQSLNPSVMITPCGPRVIHFLFKLSMYTLKVVGERQNVVAPMHYVAAEDMRPIIRKARLRMLEAHVKSDGKQFIKEVQNHRFRLSQAAEVERKRDCELMISEEKKLVEELKQKKLIEELEVEPHLKSKLQNPSTQDKAIQEWSENIRDEMNEVSCSVLVVANFENNISSTYDLLKDLADDKKKLKLVGSAFKVTVPSGINSQLMLYKDDELILHNLFKVGFEITAILQQRLGSANMLGLLRRITSLRTRISDASCQLSFYRSKYNSIGLEFYQLRLCAQQSIQADDGDDFSEIIVDSPLRNVVYDAQTPPMVLNSDDKSTVVIGLRRKRGGSLLRWILKKEEISKQKEEKTKISGREDSKKTPEKPSAEKFVSRLKQPQKIMSLANVNNRIKKLTSSENKNTELGKNYSSPKKTNKENFKPVTCLNNVVNKSEVTPKRTHDKLSHTSIKTPERYFREFTRRPNSTADTLMNNLVSTPHWDGLSMYVTSNKKSNIMSNPTTPKRDRLSMYVDSDKKSKIMSNPMTPYRDRLSMYVTSDKKYGIKSIPEEKATSSFTALPGPSATSSPGIACGPSDFSHEENNSLLKKLGNPDILNLSQESLSSNLDSGDDTVPVPYFPSPIRGIDPEGQKSTGSPTGIIGCHKKKDAQTTGICRKSLESIIARYNNIKKRQEEETRPH